MTTATGLKPGMTISITTTYDEIPDAETGTRPGSEYQPRTSLQCRAKASYRQGGYTCLATKGHTGDHMPWYGGGTGHATPWPQEGETDASGRPRYLPAEATWPPYHRTMMYKLSNGRGIGICSDCIRHDDRASQLIATYGGRFEPVGWSRNQDWQCTASWTDEHGSRKYCRNYGSRLR